MHSTMLLHLPVHIITNILVNLSLEDIHNLILVCKTLRSIIINDNILWRSLCSDKLILRSNNSGCKRQSWYHNFKVSYNWRNGYFRSKVILQHKINYMPWINLHNSEVLLVTVGTNLQCYAVNGIPNCNNLLWQLEVPKIERNDIRTNDITRFVFNEDLLVCGNRDGSTAVYKVDSIRSIPRLIQVIDNCHEDGFVEVSDVGLLRNNSSCNIVTGSDDSSNIQFWQGRDTNSRANVYYEKHMGISLDTDTGVRCLAVNESADKLAIGPNGNSRPLLLNCDTGQLLLTSDATKNRKQIVRDIQWHNENTVAYVTHSGYLQLMDIRNYEVVYTAKDPLQSTLYCVKTDGHQAFVVGSSEYSRCVLYDWRRLNHVQMYFTHKKSSPVYSLDINTTTLVTAVDRAVGALNFDVIAAKTYKKDYSFIFHS